MTHTDSVRGKPTERCLFAVFASHFKLHSASFRTPQSALWQHAPIRTAAHSFFFSRSRSTRRPDVPRWPSRPTACTVFPTKCAKQTKHFLNHEERRVEGPKKTGATFSLGNVLAGLRSEFTMRVNHSPTASLRLQCSQRYHLRGCSSGVRLRTPSFHISLRTTSSTQESL